MITASSLVDFLTEVIIAMWQMLEWLGIEQDNLYSRVGKIPDHFAHRLASKSSASELRPQRDEVNA